jgi:Uma2 family endonuclease
VSVKLSAAVGEPARKNEFITEEEYLAGEEPTEVAHEYIDGRVHAMSVPTDKHGFISANLFSALRAILQGKNRTAWMGNMRLRIACLDRPIHSIPDVLVACDHPPRDRRFREQPLAIVEVISQSSEKTDLREKLLAYTALSMLRHYFIVRQDRMEIAHIRRVGERWEEFTFSKPDQEIEIPEIAFRLSVADVYESAGR